MEDSEYELSSEPSTTTSSGHDVVDPDKLPTKKSYANIPIPRKKKKDHIIFPIMTIVLLELILPICYLINSISTQSIMGLLNIIILIVNVIITNLTKKSITGHKVILSIELVYNIILLACAATLGYRSDRKTNKALIYLGLDFNNTVVKSPLLTIIVSSIAIFLELVAVVFISKTKPEQMIRLREMFFASMGWIFSADFIWCFCLAYAGASNTSYLFMPLLLYFVYISITMGIIGRPCVPHIMQYIVYGYSILYSMYLFYQVSNIGKIYSIATQIKFVMLANRKYDYLVLSVNIIQIWLSTQLCFAFNRAGKAPKIPAFLTAASDLVLVLSFVGVLVFAVFYPCYISVLWIIIVYITSFFNLSIAKKVFFRVISLVHNFTFSCIYVTLADLYPESKVSAKILPRLNEVGLYHFKDNFTYTLLGFFLAAILAQIGRIIHYKDDQETAEQENYNELPDVVEKPKEEKKEFFVIKCIKFCFKWIKLIIVFIFKYFTAAAIIILALTYGYAENQIIYHIVWLIALCISVLGIYYRVIFEFIKFFLGITIITATFFEANVLDFHNIDDFLRKTGLAVPEGYTLAGYLWPYMVILFLTVICTNMADPIFSLPPTGATLVFWFLCFLHMLYLYLFKFNVFSLAYLIAGVWIFYCQVLNKIQLLKIAIIVSGFCVSLHQGLLMLSEYAETRNFICALIPSNIIDISTPTSPGSESVLLAVTQFTISLTYRNFVTGYNKKGIYAHGILEEIKAALRSFYFYISWIFMFFFSIANDYPTVIKLLISVFFLLGSKVARLFNKMVKYQLLFNLIFLFVEMFFEIFPNYIEKHRTILEYVGLYFVNGEYTIANRNASMTWQLLFIFVSILNIIAEHPEPTDPKFDKCLGMRLYRAFYSMLHNWLPVFVNISLCISTLYNPTIFGLFSYIILNIVQFKPKVLKRGALLITFLFNCCFMFQYLVWLGLPKSPYYFTGVPTRWLEFLSLTNIEIPALLTNMVTAFVLTFYLQFRDLAISYDIAFDELPEALKQIVLFICANIFEIIEAIAISVSIFIPTVDGIFFFLLVNTLFFATLLFEFDSHKTISIHLWGIFLVILARWISRLPYFTSLGIGKWISSLFDLPFRGSSNSEVWWIILFSLESLIIHVMETPMFQSCRKDGIQRLAYRFIRTRQLKVINRLNQEIVENLQHKKIDDIFTIAESTSNMSRSVFNLLPSMSQSTPNLAEKARLEQKKQEKDEEAKKKKQELLDNDEGDYEEDESEKKKPLKEIIFDLVQEFKDKVLKPILRKLLLLVINICPINSEAGINVLTLNSIHSILRRYASVMRIGGSFSLSPAEQNFVKKLPPSIFYQISSLGDLCGFPELKDERLFEHSMRYLGLVVRNLSLPLLLLICVIHLFVRENIWSFINLVYCFVFFAGTNLYAKPNILRLFYLFIMLMMLVRAICTVEVVAGVINNYMDSVAAGTASVNVIALFGANPNTDSNVEIFVFLIANWYIVDKLRNALVFSPHHYTETVFGGDNKLDGFPDKYFYNFDNPDKVLGLSSKQTGSVWEQIKQNANSIRIFPSNQYILVIIIDIVAFVIMLFGIDKWTTQPKSTSLLLDFSKDGITLKAIFSLIFSTVFVLIYYFLRISNNFLGIFIFNIIQLLCILFFYFIVCVNRISSLEFYMFIKFVSILIVFHDTYCGKLFANFSFPDIKKNGSKILAMNNVIRVCPFIYEIYTLLVWMSKTTYVSYRKFFVMSELKLYLENQMVYNYRHKEEELKPQRSGLIGTIFIILIILVLFGPMFFLIKSKMSTDPNPIYSASLECGLSSTGYLYKSYAHIMPMTSAQQNQLIKDSDEFDYLRSIPTSNMYLIDFPLESQLFPELPVETIDTIFKSNDYEIVYKLNLNFMRGTTDGLSPSVEQQYLLFNDTLTLENKTVLYENYLSHNGTVMFNFSLPVLLMAFYSYPLMQTRSTNQVYGLEFTPNRKLAFVHRESASTLLSTPTIRMMLYSSEVPAANEVFSSGVMATSIIGIYILIIFTFGEVLRERVLNSYEGLWIERMRHPEVLYQYIIAIEAFKLVDAYDKEYMMIEKLLDVVRSKETCIQMTNDIEEVSDEKNSSDDETPPPPSPKQNQAPKQTPETPKQQTPETPKKPDQEPPKEQNQEPPKQESPKTVEFVNVEPKT